MDMIACRRFDRRDGSRSRFERLSRTGARGRAGIEAEDVLDGDGKRCLEDGDSLEVVGTSSGATARRDGAIGSTTYARTDNEVRDHVPCPAPALSPDIEGFIPVCTKRRSAGEGS
ncbi:hypothetical protein [Natronococcus occultus]|uniref:hypothetical protein n=1 Tax=Natronococcus occultus TaxID=29288 RepID=UPI000A0602D9|nr:hypothetical protein [Natronococcus occultus]